MGVESYCCLQSSSSSTASSPTSTESSFLSSSNSENLNPTANWNLNDSLSEPTMTTFDDYSFPSSGSQGSSDGIYVDHPDLNPFSENIVELQSAIHKKLGEVMINRSPQDVLVVAKTVISFLDPLLNINGVQGEAHTEKQELSFSSGEWFDSLPDDLVISILCKLSSSATCPSDFGNVLLTCRRLNVLGLNSLVHQMFDGVKLSGGNFFVSINMLNVVGILLLDEESLQSSSSSTASSPTSTESSFLSSSNSENLNLTAIWNLNDSLSEPMTTTFDNYSFLSSGSQGSFDGIYEDHLRLNWQPAIHEKLGELMINRSPQDVLVVAKTVISFLDSLLNDLNIDGVQGEAYTERQELSFSSGNMEPVGVKYSSVAVTSSRSPVESEEIVASADSSPSPMIRLPPPQPPLPRTNCYVPIVRWRSQLQLDSRERIVNKILETLKTHLRVSGQEELHEFRKIAIWFEEKIYTAATSRSDYLQKISLKISQNPIGNALPSNSAASRDYSTAQTGHANGADWQEEVYQKIKPMKDLYLPEISKMHLKIAVKLQQHDSLPQQSKSDQLEMLKGFKTILKHVIRFLQVSKNNISPGYMEKWGSIEKQMVNFITSKFYYKHKSA